jgi:hypothetical protein
MIQAVPTLLTIAKVILVEVVVVAVAEEVGVAV